MSRTGRGSTPEIESERARKISEARKGMKFSDEHRKKLSLAHVGLKCSKETKAKMSVAHHRRIKNKRKNPLACRMCTSLNHTTQQHRDRTMVAMIKADGLRLEKHGYKKPWMCRPHIWMVGKKNPRWKGGISKQGYQSTDNFKRLRSIVLLRDDYTCFQCGCTDRKKLVAHHIDHEPSHTYLNNLITLCRGDNSRAEHKQFKKAWETKFKKYTKSISYTIV